MLRLLSAGALAALAFAGAAQGATVDRTTSGALPSVSGIGSFAFDAALGGGWTLALKPESGQPIQLAGAYATKPGGLASNAKLCHRAARVPLARAGLPAFTTLAADNREVDLRCQSGARIAVRLHAVVQGGSAVSGQMTVRAGAKLRPVLYVTWVPKRLAVYASSDCSY